MSDTHHITVLLHEAVDALDIQPSDIIVDATLGAAGHSLLIAEHLGKGGTLVALDADEKAVAQAREKFMKVAPNVRLWNANFREIGPLLEQIGYDKVDGILADLGWRQEQFGGDDYAELFAHGAAQNDTSTIANISAIASTNVNTPTQPTDMEFKA